MARPLHIVNALVWEPAPAAFARRDLYVSPRIGTRPEAVARRVDLDGYTIFPSLVNTHDHLELNHYPRTKYRSRYDNAHQWGEDVNARLNDAPFEELRAYPLADRLFIGGLKNLLCGATTVAQHNPPHKALFRRDFPVRVIGRYGWAHSLHFSTPDDICRSFAGTPPDAPWMIHLAEGTDAAARGEYGRLKALGCVGPNTVIIHGVGLAPDDTPPGLIWCPSSNLYLLGQTLDAARLDTLPLVALGSDSRLTADGDLLAELRCAAQVSGFSGERLLTMATRDAARLLRLSDAGHLAGGARADFIAIRASGDNAAALINARRANLALVVSHGVPQIGDPDVMAQFPDMPTVPALLDGAPKLIHRRLAERYLACTLKEPGFAVEAGAYSRRWFPLRISRRMSG